MKLKAALSEKGIQSLIDGVERYQRDIEEKIITLLRELVDYGATVCRAEALDLSINNTGNLISSITGEVSGSKGYVRVNCEYAVYVEFGTGVVGEKNPHPNYGGYTLGYNYDHNGHGELGWWYPTDESDINPTKYYAKDGNLYAWTRGIPSRPFMYNTAKKMEEYIRALKGGGSA